MRVIVFCKMFKIEPKFRKREKKEKEKKNFSFLIFFVHLKMML